MSRTGWIVIAILGLLVFTTIGSYNGMVTKEKKVESQWANVENAYQLRADKTKNLVEIVKGAAEFEKETLTEVVNARAKATAVQVNANDLSPEKIQQFQQAQEAFSGALSRLLVTVERYPELKSVQAFRDFQAQYEGMENRIGVERRKYNEMARSLNTTLSKFPGVFFKNLFGFEEKGYFEAQEGTESAPDVKFD